MLQFYFIVSFIQVPFLAVAVLLLTLSANWRHAECWCDLCWLLS